MNPSISSKAKANRKILKEIMEKFDSINYKNEWWHYRLNNEVYPETYFNFIIK